MWLRIIGAFLDYVEDHNFDTTDRVKLKLAIHSFSDHVENVLINQFNLDDDIEEDTNA